MGVFKSMNENQKNYLMEKIYKVQILLEEQELEKKTLNIGFNEVIKKHKVKINRLMHAIKEENQDYLESILSIDDIKKFEKIV